MSSSHILNCFYLTLTDVGTFASEAKVNTLNGHVFDISHCQESDEGVDADVINTVFRESISINVNGDFASFDVDFSTNDDYYVIPSQLSQLQQIEKELLSKQLLTKLKKEINPSSQNKTPKQKI